MIELDTIVCGDCLELMKQIPDNSIDLVLTDPPYGIKRDKGFEGFGGFGKPIYRRTYTDSWDNNRPAKLVFDTIFLKAKKVLIFGGNYFADMLPKGEHWIFWDKLNTMPTFGDGELIYTNIDRHSVKKYTLEWNGLIGKEEFRYHPTQKPLALMKYLILTYSNPGDLILDPFCGSGTTCVAAKELDRRFIGFDLEQKYVDITNKRLEAVHPRLI